MKTLEFFWRSVSCYNWFLMKNTFTYRQLDAAYIEDEYLDKTSGLTSKKYINCSL